METMTLFLFILCLAALTAICIIAYMILRKNVKDLNIGIDFNGRFGINCSFYKDQAKNEHQQ